VDCGHTIVYCVAHLVGRRGFDEIPNSAAHGGTVVNNKESGGPDHAREKVLRLVAKNNTEMGIFLH
jgi:hypothetical protein